MKRSKRRRINWRRLLTVVLAAVLAFSVVMLAITLIRYLQDRAAYAEARAIAVFTPAPTAVFTPEPAATPSPVPLETPPIAVDFGAIRQEGIHVRGWIYNAGTAINYPVVYYSNNTYYLDRDYTGKHSNAGAIFFDARVGKELGGDNLIIYGHHMKDGSMFRHLLQYHKQDYYDAHPTMYLLTLDGNFRIDLFASRHMDSSPEQYPIWFESAQAKEAFVRTAIANSDFTPVDDQYRPDSRMVTLVTCAYSNYVEDAKYLVYGWLTPIGQGSEITQIP